MAFRQPQIYDVKALGRSMQRRNDVKARSIGFDARRAYTRAYNLRLPIVTKSTLQERREPREHVNTFFFQIQLLKLSIFVAHPKLYSYFYFSNFLFFILFPFLSKILSLVYNRNVVFNFIVKFHLLEEKGLKVNIIVTFMKIQI